MAGISETRTWNDILTTTLAIYRTKMQDQIFDVYPLLSYLNGKLGVAVNGRKLKRVESGGESVVEPLLYEENSTAGSYSRYDQLDTTPQDEFTIARYDWKQYSASITIDGLSERSNMGKFSVVNLLKAKTRATELALRKTLSAGAWGDGTDNGSKTFGGLALAMSTSSTLGGIAPATNTWWKASVTTGGSFAAQGLTDMRTVFNTLSFGNDKPDIIFTTQSIYEFYEAAVQPIQRVQNTKVADLGFQNFTYKGVPFMFDRDCTSGEMHFLNSEYINYVVHKDADMKTTPFVKPTNQDARTAQILLQGNITYNNRRKLGVINTITA
jgi:hypothetical protein|tara:strand:+ start:1531 stop:2505 length:975 start_codon:yes stop_codon:yes gene_type:complete